MFLSVFVFVFVFVFVCLCLSRPLFTLSNLKTHLSVALHSAIIAVQLCMEDCMEGRLHTIALCRTVIALLSLFRLEINHLRMDVAMCYKWMDGMDVNLKCIT